MADMTLADLSKLSGLPANSVQRYLSMDRAIDVDVLNALAGALDTTAASVMTRAQERLSQRAAGEVTSADRAAYEAMRGNSSLGDALDRGKGRKDETPTGRSAKKSTASHEVADSVNKGRREA